MEGALYTWFFVLVAVVVLVGCDDRNRWPPEAVAERVQRCEKLNLDVETTLSLYGSVLNVACIPRKAGK